MSSGIPLDTNYRTIGCQLGGLTLNGNVNQKTASSFNVLIVNDPSAAQTLTKTITSKFIQVNIGGVNYYLPLYQ